MGDFITSSHHYKLVLQYKGSAYQGWQIQKKGTPTIQGELNKILTQMCKGGEIRSLGSGRTDAGVHALGQVVKISLPFAIEPSGILRGLNAQLPSDIKVLSVEPSSERFMPTADAAWKEYVYVFTTKRETSAFQSDLIGNYPYDLDIDQMHEVCKRFIGKHDFRNFYCVGTDVKSTVREIFECDLTFHKQEGMFASIAPEYYLFRVRGNGFLKQMVRLLVGSMWNVGRGKISLKTFDEALHVQVVGQVAPVAPASGLYLREVHYLLE